MQSQSQSQYDSYLNTAKEFALEAGKMIEEAFITVKVIKHKEGYVDQQSSVDLVTETDTKVEKFLIENISKRYPDHMFLAEESYKGGRYEFTEKPTWIIDPIDGTTNFVHRYPFVCVSIALAINKIVVVGVVHNPILKETFSAVTGKGAFLNNKQIYVSDAKSFKSKCNFNELWIRQIS